MRCAWLSDIHLNCLLKEERTQFYESLKGVSAVLITGDISESMSIKTYLLEMAKHLRGTYIYYVAGNHDFYDSYIDDVRAIMYNLSKDTQGQILWLGQECLTVKVGKTLITGVDGWADMRLGNQDTDVKMNDENYIYDLRDARITNGLPAFREKRRALADMDASTLYYKTVQGLRNNSNITNVMVLTHVPPYAQCCKFNGRLSEEYFVPYFSSKATGDVLDKLAEEFPTIQFRVFCGHTHYKAYYKPHKNMIVRTAHAEYYRPKMQRIVRIV